MVCWCSLSSRVRKSFPGLYTGMITSISVNVILPFVKKLTLHHITNLVVLHPKHFFFSWKFFSFAAERIPRKHNSFLNCMDFGITFHVLPANITFVCFLQFTFEQRRSAPVRTFWWKIFVFPNQSLHKFVITRGGQKRTYV